MIFANTFAYMGARCRMIRTLRALGRGGGGKQNDRDNMQKLLHDPTRWQKTTQSITM